LQPLLGTKWAPILFAVALIAAGQSSTITGTSRPNHHGRLFESKNSAMGSSHHYQTNCYCCQPLLLLFFGEGDWKTFDISGNFKFAIRVRRHSFDSLCVTKQKMNGFHISKVTQVASWIVAFIIVVLNGKLVYDEIKVG
jgi:manganese transport protein